MAFVVYFNLLVLGKSWIETGQVSFGAFLLALHGGALVLALVWLAKRHNNWVLRGAARPHRNTAPKVTAMKTIRRLLYGEVMVAVLLVTLGFVSLFYFFDFVEELQAVGKHRGNGLHRGPGRCSMWR